MPTLSTSVILALKLACSAFGVLEVLACPRLTVLLAFFLAVVARQMTGSLELTASFGVLGNQRLRYAVAHRLGLSTVPTASHGSLDIVLVCELEQLQRLSGDH